LESVRLEHTKVKGMITLIFCCKDRRWMEQTQNRVLWD